MKKAIILASFLTLTALPVWAQGLVPCGNAGQPACTICDFFVMFKNIIDFFVLKVVPPVAILMAAVAGILFILGSGFDPGLIYKARAVFKSLMVGLLIIYGSWMLVNTFFVFMGAASLQGTWFVINCH